MAVKRKPDHFCTQEETIKRISYLLVGNGEPEEGLAFKFAEFMKDHVVVVKNIEEIKEGVKGLHERSDENRAAAVTVANALEKYQAETKQFEAGKESLRVKRNLTISRVIQTVTILIALFMAALGYKNLTKGQKEIKTETQVTNDILAPTTRGEYFDPFASDSLNKK